MATCPACDRPCAAEHLKDGWRLCARTKLAYRTDAAGRLIEWATTNLSHPKGIFAVDIATKGTRRAIAS